MDNEKILWDILIKCGYSKAGAAGIIGNLYCESSLNPERVELLGLKRMREAGKSYTHRSYTEAVDNGTISKEEFMNPLPGKQYGYGIAQWTYPSRKSALYDYAKKSKRSIGDLMMQAAFLVGELETSYRALSKTLKSCTDVQTASNAFLMGFDQAFLFFR